MITMSTATTSSSRHAEEQPFEIRHLRKQVSDLFQIRPIIYWADLILSLIIGYGAATFFLRAPILSIVQFIALPIAAIGIYRVSLFMHEIVHFQKGEMVGFKVFWNLFAGIPMLTPSFFYETHIDHHNTRHYGTEEDGEYLPLASTGWLGLLKFLLQPFYLPLLTITRFVVVTPLTFLHPSIRRWAFEHWSSFVIDLRYKRPIKKSDPIKLWTLLEIGCSIRGFLLFAAPFLIPIIPWYQFLLIYVIAISVLTLNHFRTLVAHRYRGTGERMSHAEQLFDSIDITGDPVITEFVCPVGLRYHALHHLFPGMPYHNLREAHRRLMQNLPANSPYRQCVYPNYFSALAQLISDVRRSRSRDTIPHHHMPQKKNQELIPANENRKRRPRQASPQN